MSGHVTFKSLQITFFKNKKQKPSIKIEGNMYQGLMMAMKTMMALKQ